MTNTLAYYDAEFIAAVKSFIEQAPGVYMHLWKNPCINEPGMSHLLNERFQFRETARLGKALKLPLHVRFRNAFLLCDFEVFASENAHWKM